MSARFASDMASAYGSSITGSNVVLSQRLNANQMRHMPLRSTTMLINAFENGSRTLAIFINHPQRNLYEVHYARCVGTPSFLTPPSGLGISTRLTGCGW